VWGRARLLPVCCERRGKGVGCIIARACARAGGGAERECCARMLCARAARASSVVLWCRAPPWGRASARAGRRAPWPWLRASWQGDVVCVCLTCSFYRLCAVLARCCLPATCVSAGPRCPGRPRPAQKEKSSGLQYRIVIPTPKRGRCFLCVCCVRGRCVWVFGVKESLGSCKKKKKKKKKQKG